MVIRANRVGQPGRDAGADDHAKNDRVKRKLDQHAAGCRNRIGNGPHEPFRSPMQKQSGGNEHQVVGVQVQRGERALRRGAEEVDQIPDDQRRHQDRQQRTVLQPLARLCPRLQRTVNRLVLDAEVSQRSSLSPAKARRSKPPPPKPQSAPPPSRCSATETASAGAG